MRVVYLASLACLVAALPAYASTAAMPPARAEAPAELRRDSDWTRFDDLVAQAKSAMMADPEAALQRARMARDVALGNRSSPRSSEALATSYWLEAEALTRVNRVDDARVLIHRAIQIARADGKNTKLDGDLALSLARIADSKGDISLALRSYHRAHDVFAALGEPRGQAMALQGLGSIYDEAHDFDRSIQYYRRAAEAYSDPALDLSAANNLGFALQQLGRYDEAVKNLRRALDISRGMKSAFLEARILTNLATVYAKRHQFEEAETAADNALRLLGPRDENGWAPFVWGVKAELEYERKDLDAAATYLDRAFLGINIATTISPFRDIHEIAYKVYRAKGNHDLALAHHVAFKRLDDEGRSLSASANLALRGAQFDFATQQLEIEHLKTEQLKRDISLRESRAATQSAVFGGLLLVSLICIVWMLLLNVSARRHRKAITKSNVALTNTVTERDREITRRTEIESQLRQAKDTAEQSNRAKTQFLANMSHELRTPLNAIMGFSEVISAEMLGPVGTAMYRNYASDIHASGRHLLAILNDILDMARVDAGKFALVETNVDLGEVVQSALRVFGEEVRDPNKTIRFTNAQPGISVRGDERMLRQIVINLVSNAVKFTGAKGLVDIRIEPAIDGVDLVVRDNGIGIPQDKLGLVMEPFGQVGDAFARSHGGVGLGLSIVKSLVELHGGHFELASKVYEGTEARVHLPAERLLPSMDDKRPDALAS